MRVFELRDRFGLENLCLAERDDPTPGPREVLVRLKASSLNRRDLMMVEGTYNPRQKLPLIPLSDGVGEVLDVGDEVSRVSVGDRVSGTFVQGWSRRPVPRDAKVLRRTLGGPIDGMLRARCVLPEDDLVKVPQGLSDLEAATLPCVGPTAWSALVTEGGLKPGETLVVQGTGGVALFALKLAKTLGARVIVTSSSDEKLDRARALGADEVIQYRRHPAWSREVLRLTDGGGADHVLELGGAGTFNESLRAVRAGGRISVIGVLAGRCGEIDLAPILMRNIRVQGVFVGAREDFEALNSAIAQHRLRPVVDQVFPFEEARAAFLRLASDQHFGKVVVDHGDAA
ncbi:MAG: NAD(P)-dependent alcohol dehydrogenase [Deltaproteobacteria bacterium]|nr:NAD(P)-dependent alcohol dehydrogenase [Deltaproteobacteria bacterium]